MTENTTTPAPQPSFPWEPGTATYQRPLDPPPATPGYFQTPPPAPKKPWFKKPAVLLTGFGLACFVVGGAIGTSGQPEPQTVEVTKEVPGPERTVTKEVKVNVPTTPAACLEALDINEQAFTLLSTSLGHVMDGDYAAANTATEKVKALVPKVNAAKSECRASR